MFYFELILSLGTMLSFKHKMNFSPLPWGYTDYFEVTVVRDTTKVGFFEIDVYVQFSVKLRQLGQLFTHNFIPLFIVHQNPIINDFGISSLILVH